MPEVGVSEEGVCCKIKNEIFVRIDHTSQNYLFPINFFVVETVVVCQKLIHVYAYVLVV